MRPLKVEENIYLVEWKYKDFLRIGHEFQGKTIVKLEKTEYAKEDYIKVILYQHQNHL